MTDFQKPYARILPQRGSYFVHVVSRVVDRRFILGGTEKAHFRELMRKLAGFCGIDVVTYVIMDNHFHLLLQVNEREELDDAEIASRIRLINGAVAARMYLAEIERRRQLGEGAVVSYRHEFTRRMYDLGEYMKALKQQFTR